MSYGIMVCSSCKREVHQGTALLWYHCDDKTQICRAQAVYIDGPSEIKGKYCGRDGMPATAKEKRV